MTEISIWGTVRGQPGQFRRPDNKEVGSLLFPRLTGQRAAAGRFDSGPAHISANLELIIQEIRNGANDWLMERHLAARKDGHFTEVMKWTGRRLSKDWILAVVIYVIWTKGVKLVHIMNFLVIQNMILILIA